MATRLGIALLYLLLTTNSFAVRSISIPTLSWQDWFVLDSNWNSGMVAHNYFIELTNSGPTPVTGIKVYAFVEQSRFQSAGDPCSGRLTINFNLGGSSFAISPITPTVAYLVQDIGTLDVQRSTYAVARIRYTPIGTIPIPIRSSCVFNGAMSFRIEIEDNTGAVTGTIRSAVDGSGPFEASAATSVKNSTVVIPIANGRPF